MEAFALLIPSALCAKYYNGNKKLTRFRGEKSLFVGEKKNKIKGQQKLSWDVSETKTFVMN